MPAYNTVHIDRYLSDMSVSFAQETEVFVADRVFPVCPVEKQSDKYVIYSKEDWLRDEAQIRSRATQSVGGDYSLSSDQYFCEKWGYHKDVTEEDRTNSDTPLDADIDATQFVTNKILISKEVQFANNYFQPSVWGATITGVDLNPSTGQTLRWNIASSNPIADIRAAIIRIASLTGKKPNKLTIHPAVLYALEDHKDIVDRIKYTQFGSVSTDILARLFGLDEVVVAWSVINSAAKGQEGKIGFLFGNHALLSYSPPAVRVRSLTAGATFAWKGLMGATAYGVRIVRFMMEELGIGTERIEGECAYCQKIVAKDCGFFFNTIVTSQYLTMVDRILETGQAPQTALQRKIDAARPGDVTVIVPDSAGNKTEMLLADVLAKAQEAEKRAQEAEAKTAELEAMLNDASGGKKK